MVPGATPSAGFQLIRFNPIGREYSSEEKALIISFQLIRFNPIGREHAHEINETYGVSN